jgi:hypothetical protein
MRFLAALFFCVMACAANPEYTQVREGEALRMILRAPGVQRVQFACSLDAFLLREVGTQDGVTWEIQLPAGETFRFFYRIDGRAWIPDCPCREPDGFGGEDCVYEPGL